MKNKITLREATIADAEFLVSMMNDKEFKKYFPSSLISKTVEEEKKRLNHFIANSKNGTGCYFIIMQGKERVGMADIYKIDKRNNRSGIGYGILKEYWGKGIATKATKHLLYFAKKELKLHAIEATADPKNVGSQKVLEKNGFKKIGLIKDYYFENNKYKDRLLYWKIL
jgi:ribosomal-protein-alanine N-acetyltransferase